MSASGIRARLERLERRYEDQEGGLAFFRREGDLFVSVASGRRYPKEAYLQLMEAHPELVFLCLAPPEAYVAPPELTPEELRSGARDEELAAYDAWLAERDAHGDAFVLEARRRLYGEEVEPAATTGASVADEPARSTGPAPGRGG